MGGLFHLFELNQSSMARKILAQKRQIDGLEAPRNSLELQVENLQSCYAAGDPMVEEDWSGKNCSPIEASMKRLINEEMSKQYNAKKSSLSIVAKLMGVDMLPLDIKPVVQPVEKRNGIMVTKHLKREKKERNSVSNLKSSSQTEFDFPYDAKERDGEKWNDMQNWGNPRRREHPQEEELQKFKKEFEAWQARRFKECSKIMEFEDNVDQFLVHENVNKQKMARNENFGLSTTEKPVEHKARPHDRASLHRKHELFPLQRTESFPSRNKSMNRNYDHPLICCDQQLDKSSVPTKIVILRPGPDRFYDYEDSWTSSSSTFEERGSMEDFLEEVKERLKCELQGKTFKRGSVVRGRGIETLFSEKPSDPKQIAQNIAKHVRDSVVWDLGMNLSRSESTRSYNSELQFNGAGSPEISNRDTRRFFSDRLRNVVKRENHSFIPLVASGNSRSALLDDINIRLKEAGDASQDGIAPSYWETMKDDDERQTSSFRHGGDDELIHREMSPRNLVRSLSAPVSGTSFGKLLLEDRHVLTGAHIRRKHESLGNAMELKKRKKERFNIKEKVSNFRYSLTLKGRLFGRKLPSMAESVNPEQNHVRDIMSGPTVIRNFSVRQIMENSTEVPPSPASVCSSVQEDFWRPMDYPSPVSTPDVTPVDDSSMPQVFREISSNLSELRRKLGQLECDDPDDSISEQEPSECIMVELEDKVEGFIRDLLVASGLYDGSCNTILSRWDPLAKPINNLVFEKVEESCRKLSKDGNQSRSTKDHKILYDLLNEALSTVVGPPVTMSTFRRKITNFSTQPPLSGTKLLDSVLGIIKTYLYPPDDKSYYSQDTLVAKSLESTPWSCLMDDEVNALAKEIESQIIGELIDETVNDM